MFAVLVPVGPDPQEIARLHALLAELERHERPAEIRLVIVDDSPAARTFDLDWPDQVVIRTALWSRRRAPDVLSAHVAGTLEGLTRARGLEFAVKLDTDAAVIAPFARDLRAVFADPQLGVVGSYDRMSTGAVRDWSLWPRVIDRATLPFITARHDGRRRIWRRTRHDRRVVRRIRDAAYRFAPPGAHCLGGAYAVSERFLDRAALDWRPWVRTQLGEDVVVGLLCSHAGLAMRSLTGPGEPFAVAWRGLPADPTEIAGSGHSIVHSVRQEDWRDEQSLREALQRSAPAARPA